MSSTFLYKIQPTRPEMLTDGATPDEEQAISEHFEYLQKLVASGVVLLAGRTLNTDASSFGIVIFLADSEAQARQIMQQDPAVSRRVMHAELYPYRIALSGAISQR